jgi:hypothetical protein
MRGHPLYESYFFLLQEKEHGKEISDLEAYYLARKGKGEGKEYCNKFIKPRVDAYKATVKDVHGPDFVPKSDPLYPVTVIKAGHGKKHGQYYLGDGLIQTSTSLSQIQASSTSSSSGVHPRPRATTSMITQPQFSSF